MPDMPKPGYGVNPATLGTADSDLPKVTRSIGLTSGPIAYALLAFARAAGLESLEQLQLIGSNPSQEALVNWIDRHRPQVPQLRDMKAMTSNDWNALNAFLIAAGFEPLFTYFPPSDLGITAIVKKTMQWIDPGTVCDIPRFDNGEYKIYPAFRLGPNTASLQTLQDAGTFTERVVIRTKSGETLYLAMLPEDSEGPTNGADLLKLADQMIKAPTRTAPVTDGIIIPMVNFNQVDNLEWLDGLVAKITGTKPATLSACRQHIMFRMDQYGADLEAAFAGVATRGLTQRPQPFYVERHFVAAVVDPDANMTTTALYLRPDDSWSKPPATNSK